MRIASLHLKAYGPFDGAVLDLERPAAGLQIVYGPNERGKSTAMRAVLALLFGFPSSTDDAFGRDYGALRVGAVLDDGARRIALMRRKGTQRTLFTFDPATGDEHPGETVDPAVIEALLGGVDKARFEAMHGLDSAQLREHSRELLRSGSALGTTLFEAAGGVPRLRATARRLREEADALFVPRGQKPGLNVTLRELDARLEAARAAGVRPREWVARGEALARADAQVQRLETALRDARTRVAHAERLLGLGPQVARLAALRERIAVLAEVRLLPPDAGERLAAHEQALDAAQVEFDDAQARLRRNREQDAALTVSTPHLEAAAGIAQLAGRLDEHEAARLALPRLQAAEQAATDALRRALAPIEGEPAAPASGAGAGDVLAVRAVALMPSRAVVAEARQHLIDRRALEQRRADASAMLAREVRALHEARASQAALSAPLEVRGLVAAIDAAAASGDLEHRQAALRGRLETADAALARQASALGGTDVEALARLDVLPAVEVDRADAAARGLATERAALQARRAEPAETLPTLQVRRDELAARGSVLGRDRLEAARSGRDARLHDALAAPGADAMRAALAELGPAMREADRIADARFDDAARLADIESLTQRIGQLGAAIAGFDAMQARLSADEADIRRDWADRLAARSLPALDPAAYRDWAARHQRFLEALAARDALAAEHRAVELDVARHLAQLHATYAALGHEPPPVPTLAGCLAHARRWVEDAQAAAGEHERRAREVARAAQRVDEGREALAALDAAQAGDAVDRARVAASLRIDAEASAARLEARLEAFTDLREALDAWSSAQRDLVQEEARRAQFRSDVAALAGAIGEPVPADGEERAFVARCVDASAEARRARDARLSLHAEAQSLELTIGSATRRRDAARAALAAMREQAAVDTPEALQQAIERSAQRRAAEQEALAVESMIRESTGAAHDTLVAQAVQADADDLQAEIAALRESIETDSSARDAALAARATARAAVDAVDGQGTAAGAAEAVRERLAAAGRQALDWARLRLANALLEQTVQRHAQRAQGPVLSAAARWLARITGGRWRDLRPDWSGDEQILLAERDDGLRLPIERLSEGTADALFLALRLAAIEVRLAAAPPVPLLLDDVLMSFDDARAAAALQGLAELGQRNQVVYFTHHAHLVALARRVLPAADLAVTELAHRAEAD